MTLGQVRSREHIVLLTRSRQPYSVTETHLQLRVTARSNRDIDQKDAIRNCEFTLTPRALFAPDGTVLPCQDKSKLIHLLIKLAKDEES